MKLKIMGYNPQLETSKLAECYGTFEKATEQTECYKYLNMLKTGCLAHMKFYIKEEN